MLAEQSSLEHKSQDTFSHVVAVMGHMLWLKWAMPCKNVWAYKDSEDPDQTMQTDQDLNCPLNKSLDTTECMNKDQSPNDPLHMPRMI